MTGDRILVGIALLIVLLLLVARIAESARRRRERRRAVEACKVTIRRTDDEDRDEAGDDWWWSCVCVPGRLRYVATRDEAQVAADEHLREAPMEQVGTP